MTEERCMQDFHRETGGTETTLKAYVNMGFYY
jgi:hypothetical protein